MLGNLHFFNTLQGADFQNLSDSFYPYAFVCLVGAVLLSTMANHH